MRCVRTMRCSAPGRPRARSAGSRTDATNCSTRTQGFGRSRPCARWPAQRTGGAFSAWLPDPDGRPRLDPTGLVKGWAVEHAFTGLIDRLGILGAHDALVNAGGDIAVHSLRTDTPDWTIAIEDPRDRTRILRTLRLRTGAVATSGSTARGDHIIDPANGTPAAGLLSATVIGPELTWADVYATAAFVKGPRALGWLATLTNHAGVLVSTNGSVTSIGTMSPPTP